MHVDTRTHLLLPGFVILLIKLYLFLARQGLSRLHYFYLFWLPSDSVAMLGKNPLNGLFKSGSI